MTLPEKPGTLDKILGWLISGLGILMVIFHMANARTYLMVGIQFLNAHLAFCFVMVYLVAAQKEKRKIGKYLLLVCVVIVIACTLYIHFDWAGIEKRVWANTNTDLLVGASLIILGLISVKLSIGWFLLFLIVGIIIYPFFGRHLPEPFTTRAYPIANTIGNFCMNLNTGLYSNNLRTSAEYIFLFVIFGSMLSATGVQKFFWELGKLLFRKLRSGAALMTVLNSALVGTVTGSALANIMITGVYTIPTMKRAGYTPEVAGALTASSSAGGQIMPPVMGIVAFVMASYTGIPYIKIVAMAVVPALMYYLGIGIYAHFNTMKRFAELEQTNQSREEHFEAIDYRIFFWKMPGFVIPLAVIIVLLSRGVSVMEAGFWSILCLATVCMMTPKDLRPKIKDLIEGLVNGAKEGSSLGVIIIVCGLILITFTGSGLAVKLASGIQRYSGGTAIGVLLIVWVMSILFGLIGVSTVAYFMSAAFAASVLIRFGYTLEVTHFFLMFPCIFSVITPPVALACVVATKLSGGDYMKTCYETMRAAFTSFFLPFIVVYSPAMTFAISPATALYWLEVSLCFLFVISGQFAFVGYLALRVSLLERVSLYIMFVFSFLYLVMRNQFFIPLLLACIALFVISHFRRYKKIAAQKQALAV